ncbi:MAG: EthD family reductase [Gammaproteobacteria bacterium]|jgi:uncharacterized protein (TIGR02118 family)
MANAKLIIHFPHPHDVYAFDHVYKEELIPLITGKLDGKTKLVTTTALPHAHHIIPAYHRSTEIYFPSEDVLLASTQSDAGKEVLACAAEISTGGAPSFVIAEEEDAIEF